jgi:signal transduction histidine kinase
VSRLSFRARLFVALLTVSAFPLAVMAVAGVWAVKLQPRLNPDTDIFPVGRSESRAYAALSQAPLTAPQRTALQQHDDSVRSLMIAATQTPVAERQWGERAAVALILVVGFFALLVVGAGAILSRQYAAPLNEIVDWTRRILRHEPLPQIQPRRVTPELVTLQQSLYVLQQGLEQARAAELEAERLRAFGEVARRVAHEMKNPLTPIRLAVRQLSHNAPPEWHDALDVIAAESARLEAMARDFAELGRLPEGVAASVDLCELLEELLRNAVPESMQCTFVCDQPDVTLLGHYDPLRRAFSNVVRNAVEACHGEGSLRVAVRLGHGRIHVTFQDSGPGIPADKRDKIFQPYYTDKPAGTGLGLAIVRQTIEQHGGTIVIADTAPGATFVVELPA